MRKTLGRKGMWTQVFLIGFFLLLVVLAIMLLTIEKNKGVFDSKRKYVDQDLRDQHASTMLSDILRRQVQINNREVTISDAITLNFDGRYDNEIMLGLKRSMLPISNSVISIKYSGRERYINLDGKEYEYPNNYGPAQDKGIFKDYEIGKNPRLEGNCKSDNVGYASTILPGPNGNINIAFKRCEHSITRYNDATLEESERTWELTAGASETPAEGTSWGEPKYQVLDPADVYTSTVVKDAYGYMKGRKDFVQRVESASEVLNKQGITLKIVDSYRSYQNQKDAYEKYLENKKNKLDPANVMPPGTSFHEKGLAIDLAMNIPSQKEDILNHGPIYKALYDAGLRRIPNEWWHWSYGEKDLGINTQYAGNEKSPADNPNFIRYNT